MRMVEVEIYTKTEDDDEFLTVRCVEDIAKLGRALIDLELPADVWPVVRLYGRDSE